MICIYGLIDTLFVRKNEVVIEAKLQDEDEA